MIPRRLFLGALLSAPLAACQTAQQRHAAATPDAGDDAAWYVGWMDDEPFDIPLVDRSRMRTEHRRQTVPYAGSERPGTIVVDIDQRFLYLVQLGNQAIRYAIGVGRDGFSWRGVATVGRKSVWPAWSPTTTMVSLKPSLPRFRKAGLDNPLGARALYLYQNGADTLFRIHGTNEPWSIGQAVSSGCVRLLNEDVVDLYNRVPVGTTVLVRRSGRWRV
ncbi:MAG TPA: L,D-transpeptidase [Microvirga sp.]|nr:L,D-transpeptidase [Microvirga sp.]